MQATGSAAQRTTAAAAAGLLADPAPGLLPESSPAAKRNTTKVTVPAKSNPNTVTKAIIAAKTTKAPAKSTKPAVKSETKPVVVNKPLRVAHGAGITTSPNPALKGREPRTAFYCKVITKPMTIKQIMSALQNAGWPDEGQAKVVATMSYLVNRGHKFTQAGDGDAIKYSPIKK
jgi:hypothetical protein